MYTTKHRYALLILMLLIATIPAVVPCHAQDYRFHALGARDGLSSNSVNDMLVDKRGFLWVGTSLGLNRYDGYGFTSYYNYNNRRDLAATNIVELQEDAVGNLWIMGDLQVVRYDYRTNYFDVDPKEFLSSRGVKVPQDYRVIVDDDGDLWIVSDGQLQHYSYVDNKTRSWNVNFHIDKLREMRTTVNSDGIFLSDKSSVWFFKLRTGKLTKLTLPADFRSDVGHLELATDGDGMVWIYSFVSEHICYYAATDNAATTMFRLPSALAAMQGTTPEASVNNAIRAIYDDGEGLLWIATDHNGIFIYSKENGKFRHYVHNDDAPFSLPSNNVNGILTDRQGTVWLSFYNSGIAYTNPRYNMFTQKARQCGIISTMQYDHLGNLWIGTDGNGLFMEHPNGSYEKTALPNVTISSIMVDKSGTVWVGSYNNGLYQMNGPQQYTLYNKENGALTHNTVWQMIDDDKGNIWYTSVFEPLARFSKTTGKGTLHDADGEKITATTLTSDGKGNIYSGTYYGLYQYDVNKRKGGTVFGNKAGTQKFLQMYIGTLHYDKENDMLWLGHLTGISVWDLKCDSIYYIDRANGLIDTNIKAFEQDRNGNMWISVASGISSIRLSHKHGGATDISVRNFTIGNDLLETNFNTYASAQNGKGEIMFGCNDGYMLVRTAQTQNTDKKPKVTFTEVCVGDSVLSMPEGKEWGESSLELKHDDYQIVVRFFTGNILSANRVLYAYRLKGLRDEWVYTEENKVELFSLASGSYTLEVKASGDDGEWGDVSELQIYVAPPFLLSWWMMIVYAMLLFTAAYAFWKYMKLRRQKDDEAQKGRLEQGQMLQLSEMKLRFFTNISHDLRTPLTLIMSPLQSLLQDSTISAEAKKRLEMINKNAQLLYNQVNMLLDFRRLDVGAEKLKTQRFELMHFVGDACLSFSDYADERTIQMEYVHKPNELFVYLDQEKINKILYNLLSNAFKFTPDMGKIRVRVQKIDDMVNICVSDTGSGISDADKKRVFQRFYQVKNDTANAGSGIGLHIVNEYVKLHGGKIAVTDNKPTGSVFDILLPIDARSGDALDEDNAGAEAATLYDDATQNADSEDAKKDVFTVLVVDDNRDMCQFIADSISAKYATLMAYDGEQALQMLQKNDVNLVITDIMMPKIDGLELCKRIKSNIRWSHIPVIMLTAKSAEMSVVEGLQQGADDYITKPFNVEHLRLRIEKFKEWTLMSHQSFHKKIEVEPSEITITQLDEDFVTKAITIVEQNLNNPEFSVETLGLEVGMSRTNLYKKLMSLTGSGPHDFIRTIRLKRARQLIEKTSMTVSEVAAAVGYNSAKRFSENFKSEFGMTPSEYAKSIRMA